MATTQIEYMFQVNIGPNGPQIGKEFSNNRQKM
jgi:hypothetical protein